MGRLCEKCAQALQDFVNFVKRVSSRIVENMKECMAMLSGCCCLKSRGSKVKDLYQPVLQDHEKQAAQEFLKHMETGLNESPVGKETLDALMILAFSENTDLQHSAALYYLHMSQYMNIQLPAEFLEPYHALLRSGELEVQRKTSLSLVNFLLEGNLDKDLVYQMGLLEPIFELLAIEDSILQCNTCACIMTLALSETNREVIGIAGGILPLLRLAKSYDPRVQQNAVGAILNLTRSESIKSILCRQGALPVLTLLLQSTDSEVQYYSCASLGNIAANPEHHEAMLAIGDKFILRMLVSLMSSSVEKVSSQACLCLNNLATNGEVRTHLIATDIMTLIFSLLNSGNRDIRHASITLLCTMSLSPGNMDGLLSEEVLQRLAMLMQTERANRVVVLHTACTIQNLCQESNIKTIMQSQCMEELLLALLDPNNDEESLQHLASCLAELAEHEYAREYLINRKDKAFLKCLVRLSGSLEHKELSLQAATVIKHLSHSGRIAEYLKPFLRNVTAYLMSFLSHPETRFQQTGIATLCLLSQDAEFSMAISQSPLKKQLEQVWRQTEETQALLRLAIRQTDSLSLNE